MHVHAFVMRGDLVELQRIVGGNLLVEWAPFSSENLAALDRGECRVVIVDPTFVRLGVFEQLLDAVARCGASAIMWTCIDPAGVARVLVASRRFPVDVVIRGHEDERSLWRAVLNTAYGQSLGSLMLHHLAPRFSLLPVPLRTAAARYLCGVPVPGSVEAAFGSVGKSVRTVERCFAAARLCSPKRYLMVAGATQTHIEAERAVRAETPLLTSHRTSRASAEYRVAIGLSPDRAIVELSNEFVATRLLALMELAESSAE